MPTNLYDAHKEWASRPADERFDNLESLQIFTETRKKLSIKSLNKRDYKIVLLESKILMDKRKPQ